MHNNITKILTINHSDGGMVFNATFNNISVVSSWSILLVEENQYIIKHIRVCINVM